MFSTLDGVARPEEYFQTAKDRGWPAVAITEHGVFSSIPDAFWASREYGIKFIPGCEFYYNDYELQRQEMSTVKGFKMGALKESNPGLSERVRRNRHLTVLAKNEQGYHNLLEINRHAWEFGYYYKPRVWFDKLVEHKEGLIVLSGCLNGPIAHELRNKNFSGTDEFVGAIQYMDKFNEVFGDDYYIEVQMPCLSLEDTISESHPEGWSDRRVFRQLVEMAKHKGKKIVLTNDSHYMNREDFQLQKVMMAVAQGTTIDDPELFHVNSDEQYYKTRAELRDTFLNRGYSKGIDLSVFEDACDTTLEIADKCDNFEFDCEPKLPIVEKANEALTRAAFAGLKEKGLHKSKRKYVVDGVDVTHYDQMVIELKRITEKGFSSYFLITKDLVDHARELYGRDGIGPGRGSAGGCLLCYLLGITDVDPLKWRLSFSRMLSPARGGMMLKVTM
jgi:DNA polymerase-3 subunit alpha